jgi:GH15 family glucan-1,4-alpha-glucosidase
VLHASLFGFLPADDPRMVSTVDRVIEELGEGEVLVHRYDAAEVDDGLSGPEDAFLLSSCWPKRARKQDQNNTKTTYSVPEPGAQESAKEFFNRLGCSPQFGCRVRLLGLLH